MKILLALLLAATANAGPLINGNQINPQTAISISTLTVTGATGLTSSTVTVNVDGQTPSSLPNSPLRVTGSANTDVQVYVQNKSAGASANSGFFSVADNGTNSTNGTWCGVNSSGYVGATNGWFDGPDDGVCYALSGNFGLGAAASGKSVNIFAGGTLAGNIVETISSTGTTIYPSQFSVGGSTFVIAGGTATVAYQLSAQNVRVRSIASGTQCLQADSSGNVSGTGSSCATTTGFATLTATQTFSGSNTFAGPGVSSTTFNNIGVIGASAGGFFSVPTQRLFTTTGAQVYYSTASTGVTPRQITADCCAGGGGGAVSAGNGGSTWFASIEASSGTAGGSTCQAGTGGTGGFGAEGQFASSTTIRMAGNGGTCGIDAASIQGGSGGGSALFGGGAAGVSSSLHNGIAGTGGGGSGNPTLDGASSGGGGGECFRLILNNPAANYSANIFIGAGGVAGTSGGAGGSGKCVVYQSY